LAVAAAGVLLTSTAESGDGERRVSWRSGAFNMADNPPLGTDNTGGGSDRQAPAHGVEEDEAAADDDDVADEDDDDAAVDVADEEVADEEEEEEEEEELGVATEARWDDAGWLAGRLWW
jgi:hypothetical protein